MQSPTDAAAKQMEALGISVYDSEGNMRSLNDILGDLNSSMDGMTSAEKSNIISTIFNKTDLSSVNALLANSGSTWDDLQQKITDSGGAAQQMADTQLDNLQGQITIADRPKVEFEKMLDGYTGFLCIDDNGEPLVAMHWEHRFNHMLGRYNSIFKVQMPNITPHVCRHTYCTNQAKAGMSPKTLQYLMGHSEIGVTLNTYTHLGLEDATEEIKRMENLEKARKEMYGEEKEKPMKQNMFKVV